MKISAGTFETLRRLRKSTISVNGWSGRCGNLQRTCDTFIVIDVITSCGPEVRWIVSDEMT